MGLNHRVKCQKPYLSDTQQKACLKFALKHKDWGFEEWSRVAFTDEVGFQTGANDKKIYMWRAPDEEYHKDTVGTTHISGFRKIKFWSAIRCRKKSKGVIINEKEGEGKINLEDYIKEIMDEELFDF